MLIILCNAKEFYHFFISFVAYMWIFNCLFRFWFLIIIMDNNQITNEPIKVTKSKFSLNSF